MTINVFPQSVACLPTLLMMSLMDGHLKIILKIGNVTW